MRTVEAISLALAWAFLLSIPLIEELGGRKVYGWHLWHSDALLFCCAALLIVAYIIRPHGYVFARGALLLLVTLGLYLFVIRP